MTTIFGIRHHGPGCARSLLAALDALQPDVVLIEMPQEFEPLLAHAAHEAMKPPVALLVHRTDLPEKAAFYPFAGFSPEWNAIRWAVGKSVPLRCFDLPSTIMFALRETDEETPPRPDAFEWFAKADGYSDGERWWNDRVEERRDHRDLFEAILEAVTELRGELKLTESRETLLREAWMRKCLRAAEKDGFTNIAVVCGAWHAPALHTPAKTGDDNAWLKNLPKHKVSATWIPWTDERMTFASGYGAGIRSPGWYEHLWSHPHDPIPTWITRAARILRGEGQEASSASVIEALRLSNSLAGMRGRPLPGLDETLESMQAVFCQGDPLPLDFLNRKLLVGERLGELPEGLPALPLQQDIDAHLRRLRLKPAASVTPLELDLRDEGGRARSVFLHRMLALQIPWGRKEQARGKGTFKEKWTLQWKPELVVAIIDASVFGNTVETAAAAKLIRPSASEAGLAPISARLDLALLGGLNEAVQVLLQRLDSAAAASHDLSDLLAAVPTLASISRYGDVRATDVAAVGHLLNGFAARIHAGLLLAASGIDDNAAEHLGSLLGDYGAALSLMEHTELVAGFHDVLAKLCHASGVHPRLCGHAVRTLRDGGRMDDAEVARQLGFALSQGMPAAPAAAWLEGFLRGGGSLLVHDRMMLGLVDAWLGSLGADAFQAVLPLVRRTFGTFSAPERARIAAGVAKPGAPAGMTGASAADYDLERAMPAIRAVAELFAMSRS
jgi:hypothetical protein